LAAPWPESVLYVGDFRRPGWHESRYRWKRIRRRGRRLYILDSKGKKLGRIVHGYSATTNIGFGGNDWKTLYFTSRANLDAVNAKIEGQPGGQGQAVCHTHANVLHFGV
jgi:hypothetical protein